MYTLRVGLKFFLGLIVAVSIVVGAQNTVSAATTYTVRSDGTVLENGTSLLPFGFYVVAQAPHANNTIRNQYITDMGDGGFNFIFMSYIDGFAAGALFDNAHARGVRVAMHTTSWWGDLGDYLSVYGGKSSLLGHFTGDDINLPCGSPTKTATAQRADVLAIKSQDPSRLTVGSYVGEVGCAIRSYIGIEDVLIHYVYPIDNWRPHAEELEQGAVANKYMYDELQASGKKNVSLWNAVQTYRWSTEGAQYPSRSELRNLLYSGFVYGAKGVAAYAYAHTGSTYLPVDAAHNWDEMKKLKREVDLIAPAILDGTRTILNTGPSYRNFYHAAVWEYRGEAYVVLVNTYRLGSRSISITLPSSVAGTLEPLFADRPSGMTFNNTTKVLTGTVGSEEVHVYRIGVVSEDTTPPTVPSGLTAHPVSPTQVNLSWTASTDAVGVSGYRVYRNGSLLTSVVGTTYENSGLSPETTYTYRVSAYDARGNVSAQSAAATATTHATRAICGNGVCEAGETNSSCPSDCPPPTSRCTNAYSMDVSIPVGYGASYNLFSSTKELLVKGTVCPASGPYTVEAGGPSVLTFKDGYRWDGSAWQPISFSGGAMLGNYYTGVVTASIALAPRGGFFVAYTCQRVLSTWKCGCRDTTCSSSSWQIQKVAPE